MSKYTDWIDAETPPVHKGWYPVTTFGNGSRKHWNGIWWSVIVLPFASESTVRQCAFQAGLQTGFKWRGLTEPHPDWRGE